MVHLPLCWIIDPLELVEDRAAETVDEEAGVAAFQVENAGIEAHCGRWCEWSGLEWGC